MELSNYTYSELPEWIKKIPFEDLQIISHVICRAIDEDLINIGDRPNVDKIINELYCRVTHDVNIKHEKEETARYYRLC